MHVMAAWVGGWFLDVSGKHTDPILKVHAAQEEFCLTVEYGIGSLSQNIPILSSKFMQPKKNSA
jgi:hypothetical protein